MLRIESATNRLGLPGGVIGYIDDHNAAAVLHVVMVDEDARGRGIGRRLVADFEAWALENGAQEITGASMPEAVGFWENLGYEVLPILDIRRTLHAPAPEPGPL